LDAVPAHATHLVCTLVCDLLHDLLRFWTTFPVVPGLTHLNVGPTLPPRYRLRVIPTWCSLVHRCTPTYASRSRFATDALRFDVCVPHGLLYTAFIRLATGILGCGTRRTYPCFKTHTVRVCYRPTDSVVDPNTLVTIAIRFPDCCPVLRYTTTRLWLLWTGRKKLPIPSVPRSRYCARLHSTFLT